MLCHSFYKNDFLKHEAHLCSKFKNKLKTLPASAAKQTKKKKFKQIKETKFVLIQNDKISVIFLCLQAKLQLFKVIKLCCSAQAIEKFFRQLFNLKKACFFAFAI